MILMPMSPTDFDPTEAAVAWKILSNEGFEFQFATPNGKPAQVDERMLTGEGLGPWKRILAARRDAVDAHNEMAAGTAFKKPVLYSELKADDYQGLLLHGGHAPGMRAYLESTELQKIIADFLAAGKPVGAICHGVLLLGRSKTADGKSVLHGRKCTTLLKKQEMAAFRMTRLWLGNYYRTYPETTCQEEVVSYLKDKSDFQTGSNPLFRDSREKLGRGFTVRDGNLLTARWPGDAYNFGLEYLKMVQ